MMITTARTTRPVPDPATGSLSAHPGPHRQPARGSAGSTPRAEVPGPPRGRRHHGGGPRRVGCRRGGRAGRGDRVVRGARSRALGLDPRRRPARIGVHGCVRDHAAPAARGRRRQRGHPADAGHGLRRQRGVGLGSAGRTGPGHRLHLSPLHPAGRGCPAGRWSLLAGGVVSSAAAALVVVAGGLASGNILAAALAVPGGMLTVAVLAAAGAAARRPRLGGGFERLAASTLRQASRLSGRLRASPARSSGPGRSGWVHSSFPCEAG